MHPTFLFLFVSAPPPLWSPAAFVGSSPFAAAAGMQFTMDNRNKEFARSLRQRAHELPPGDKARYGMFIAAKHIENHTTPLTTDKQAREVPRVGVKIVEMLVELGLEISTSKRDRMYIGGANAVVPAKRRALGASAVPLLSNPRVGNAHIAHRLRDFAASRTGTFLP